MTAREGAVVACFILVVLEVPHRSSHKTHRIRYDTSPCAQDHGQHRDVLMEQREALGACQDMDGLGWPQQLYYSFHTISDYRVYNNRTMGGSVPNANNRLAPFDSGSERPAALLHATTTLGRLAAPPKQERGFCQVRVASTSPTM